MPLRVAAFGVSYLIICNGNCHKCLILFVDTTILCLASIQIRYLESFITDVRDIMVSDYPHRVVIIVTASRVARGLYCFHAVQILCTLRLTKDTL